MDRALMLFLRNKRRRKERRKKNRKKKMDIPKIPKSVLREAMAHGKFLELSQPPRDRDDYNE